MYHGYGRYSPVYYVHNTQYTSHSHNVKKKKHNNNERKKNEEEFLGRKKCNDRSLTDDGTELDR